MKRTLAVIGFLLMAGTSATAYAQGGGLGIKGGLSYGNVSNSGAFPGSVSQRSGFAIGLSGNTGGVIGLGIEGLYAQRGFDNSVAADARHLDYIDVPIYLRLAAPPGTFAPFAYAGPQGSYELNCGTDSGNCPDSGRPKVTYSGVIGAGLAFGMQRLDRGALRLRPHRSQAEHHFDDAELPDAVIPAAAGAGF